MARKLSRGAGSSEPNDNDERDGKPSLGRRALLSRGGVVAAGVVGAGAVATAMAGPASAQATTPVDTNTVNDAGTSATPTELGAANDTTPAFIVANTGVDTDNNAGPNLQLTPSTAAGGEPTASAVGGDLTTTGSGAYTGQLWFTHNFGGTPPEIVSAPVHTEATANVFAPLGTPTRILDTRSTAGRKNVINASGNLSSTGQLLSGKTIYINLDTLVVYAQAVLATVTVLETAGSGYLTLWSGEGAKPTVSQINYVGKNASISSFVSVEVWEYSSTIANAIAIHASETTQVILDVFAFIMPGYEYANYSLVPPTASAAKQAARLQRARQALRAARS